MLAANLVLLVLLGLHVADHGLRQEGGGELTGFAAAPGLAGVLVVVLSLALVARRHRWAPRTAAAVGASTAIGFVIIHLLPDWGAFSDPYPARSLDAASWASMLGSLAAGVVLAAVSARRRWALTPP